MPEYAGPLQSVELAAFLWLAPLIPLGVAVYVAVAGLVLARGLTASRSLANPKYLGASASLLALVVITAQATALGVSPERALLSHGWGILRIGSLDVGFTLVLEPSTVVLALAVSLVASTAMLCLPRDSSDHRAAVAGIALAHSGMLLVILANDWALLLCGSNLVGIGVYCLFVEGDDTHARQLFMAGRVGDAFTLAAAVVLLWGLGGSWTGGGDYVPDFRPRIVSAVSGDPKLLEDKKETTPRGRAESEGEASISSAALPGSQLSLGGGDLCEVDRDGKPGGLGTTGRPCTTRARTPFSHVRVPAALHDIRFHTGPGSNDLMAEKVRLQPKRDTLLVVAGTTLSLRDAREQLLLRDGTGAYPLRAALAKRKFFALPFWGVVAGLLAFGALSRVFFAPVRIAKSGNPRGAALLVGTELMIGAVVVSRADFAFALVPGVASVTAIVAAIGALWLALSAAHAEDTRVASVGVVGSAFALAIAGLALGAHSGAIVLIAVTALSGAAFLLALAAVGATTLSRSTGLGSRFASLKPVAGLAALALTGAPIPIALARGGIVEDVARAEAFGLPVGWLLSGLCLIVNATAAFAAWRVCFVVFSGEPEKKKKPVTDRTHRRAVAQLAIFAIALGLLALPAGAFGEGAPAPLDRLLTIGAIEEMAAPGAPLDASVRLGLVVLSLVAGVVGFVLARSRYRAKRREDWKQAEADRIGHGVFAGSARPVVATIVLPFTLLAALSAKLDALLERTALGLPPNDAGEDDA